MAPVAQQYWSVDDAAAASVLEHLEQMQTKHGPLPPPPSPVNAQHCNGRDFAGLFGPPLSQHDPPHEPQRIGWGNGTKRGGSGAGLGDISDAAPRLGPARPARFNLIRVSGQQDVTRTRSPRSRVGAGRFGFRGRHARETVVRARRELQGRSSAGEGIPTPLCTARCLGGGEPKLARSYARTVSEMSAVGTALFFAAKLPTRFLKFLPPLGPSAWDPSVANIDRCT